MITLSQIDLLNIVIASFVAGFLLCLVSCYLDNRKKNVPYRRPL